MEMKFPSEFLWGGACSACQYEGGYREGGKGLSVSDVMTSGNRNNTRKIAWFNPHTKEKGLSEVGAFWGELSIPEGAVPTIDESLYYPSHVASDFYHRYLEDISLFAELGFSCFRMSISWSRIFPNGDDEKPNCNGLNFYHKVFEQCKKYHIEPIVTTVHYDLPLSLCIGYGGWKNRELISLYENYCKTLFSEFKNDVKYWITFNEINSIVVENFKAAGMYEQDEASFAQAAHNILVASAKVIKMGRKIMPLAKFGCMVACTLSYPQTCKPSDQISSLLKKREYQFFLDVQCRGEYPTYQWINYKAKDIKIKVEDQDFDILKEGRVDYISFSYYTTGIVEENMGKGTPMGPNNPYLKTNAWGWGIDPHGLRYALCELFEQYQLPLMIVENGYGCFDEVQDGRVHDLDRIQYLEKHIQAIHDAIYLDGIPILGYTVWSCVDIISLGTGEINKRYGLIYVDQNDQGTGTLNRIKKDSFYWYKAFIQESKQEECI